MSELWFTVPFCGLRNALCALALVQGNTHFDVLPVVDTSACLQVKNALCFLASSVPTDEVAYCRTQEQEKDNIGNFRISERVVVIGNMYTEIMPESRTPWAGMGGKWALHLPLLRCVYCLITHQCGVTLTQMSDVYVGVVRWKLWTGSASDATDGKGVAYSCVYAGERIRQVLFQPMSPQV